MSGPIHLPAGYRCPLGYYPCSRCNSGTTNTHGSDFARMHEFTSSDQVRKAKREHGLAAVRHEVRRRRRSS